MNLNIIVNNEEEIKYAHSLLDGVMRGRTLEVWSEAQLRWVEAYDKAVIINVMESYVRFRNLWETVRLKPLEFPKPPEGEKWFNPNNLTPEQIEVNKGYRLLLESELDPTRGDGHPLSRNCEAYYINNGGWAKYNYGNSSIRDYTYRTKVPLPTKKTTTTYEYTV